FQRRRFPRIDITLPVEYNVVETEEEKVKAVIAQNISTGGLLLVLPEFQPVSTCLRVRLYLGTRDIDAGVRVAWTEILTGREKNEFLCGVFFTDIVAGDLEFIREFITEYMERERE
ncbi:MAG: PilZ domain-containing protein, partial [Nitrospirota bacterium]|nr:PilZ domain-containing protein [Nitrospirota bacterium]